jgi:hypothetical protein
MFCSHLWYMNYLRIRSLKRITSDVVVVVMYVPNIDVDTTFVSRKKR